MQQGFFFLSAKVRDGNSSSRQSPWLLAMSNCFVLDATWARWCSLFLSHMHTHPLGSAPAPRDGSGGAKLLLLFTWIRSLKMCKMHVCTSEPPAAWKHTWLHREKGKIASGNVLNVQRVENLGRVGEPVWDGHCSLKKGQNGPGKFRGQVCVHVGQTREKLHLVCCSSEQRMGIRTGHKYLCALGSHVLTGWGSHVHTPNRFYGQTITKSTPAFSGSL